MSRTRQSNTQAEGLIVYVMGQRWEIIGRDMKKNRYQMIPLQGGSQVEISARELIATGEPDVIRAIQQDQDIPASRRTFNFSFEQESWILDYDPRPLDEVFAVR